MGLFSGSNQAKERVKTQQAELGYLGAQGIEAVDSAKASNLAAEQARASLFGALGSPGSYDLPGAAGEGQGADFSGVYDESQGPSSNATALLKTGTKQARAQAAAFMSQKRQGILDPAKYTAEMKKTAGFRIQSKLTADAEQLLHHEGAAWQELDQATRGQIFEGSATQLRETIRDIKNRAGKGGSARREAMDQAQELLARERATTMRVNETWNANLKLDEYVRANAASVQQQNIQFMDNLPMIRQQYNQTMNSLAEMMAKAAVPNAMEASAAGAKLRNSVPESKVGEKLILGALSGVISGVTGGAQTAGDSQNQGTTESILGQIGNWAGNKAGSYMGGLFGGSQQQQPGSLNYTYSGQGLGIGS